jgi:cell wall-associated NlpC family hydrolase
MAKTAEGLLAHAQTLLGSPYMWGTYGKKITHALIDEKAKQYPAQYAAAYIQTLRGFAGSGIRAVACVGLVKAYMMTETPGGDPVYQAAYDNNVAGLRGACSPLEGIATLPEIPGLLLFVGTTHVGVSLGNGQVIEAVGSDCVKITERKKGKWSDWGKLRWIVYPTAAPQQAAKAPTASATPATPTASTAPAVSAAPKTEPFTNTSGGDLPVYADTSLRQRIGTLPAGNRCNTLGVVNGMPLLLYRVSGTTEYKSGFCTPAANSSASPLLAKTRGLAF